MNALFWMLTWLPQVLSAMSRPPQPVNPILNSSHFRHMLKWKPGPGTPSGVYYHVAVHTYRGTSWEPVVGCKRVHYPLVCNMTDALSHPNKTYFVKVTAQLAELESQPATLEFKPIRDTQMDLPMLTVTPCGRNLCVDLKPPMEHLREIYGALHYTLKIHCSGTDAAQFVTTRSVISLRREIIKDLAPGRQYCVSVCFSDKLLSKESNYSQPVCAFTTSNFSADLGISAGLCVLVILVVVVGIFLFFTGFICLKRGPLPTVLLSVHHMEEVLVVAPPNTLLPSLLTVRAARLSLGEKSHKLSSSEESDEDSETETTGGAYKLRACAHLSSSFTCSSSFPAALSPRHEPLLSSNQTSESAETHSSAAQSTDTQTAGTTEPDKEEGEVVVEEGSHDVNLLTLTFGRHEEEQKHKSHFGTAEFEEKDPVTEERTSVQPPQTEDTRDVAMETVSSAAQEEQDEEESGYMGRQCTDVLQTLL